MSPSLPSERIAEAIRQGCDQVVFLDAVERRAGDRLDGEAAVAHEAGLPLIVDNTMPSPYLVQPLRHGAANHPHGLGGSG